MDIFGRRELIISIYTGSKVQTVAQLWSGCVIQEDKPIYVMALCWYGPQQVRWEDLYSGFLLGRRLGLLFLLTGIGEVLSRACCRVALLMQLQVGICWQEADGWYIHVTLDPAQVLCGKRRKAYIYILIPQLQVPVLLSQEKWPWGYEVGEFPPNTITDLVRVL